MTGLAEFICLFLFYISYCSLSILVGPYGERKSTSERLYCSLQYAGANHWVLNMHGNADIVGRSMVWWGRDYFIPLLAIQRNGIVCQDSLVRTYLEALFYLRLQLVQTVISNYVHFTKIDGMRDIKRSIIWIMTRDVRGWGKMWEGVTDLNYFRDGWMRGAREAALVLGPWVRLSCHNARAPYAVQDNCLFPCSTVPYSTVHRTISWTKTRTNKYMFSIYVFTVWHT